MMAKRLVELQPTATLSRWERVGLSLLILAFLVQGVNVANRSVFLERRFTDLGIYLRAAWAAGAGQDIYAITDNGCHYVYPPALAILLTPFAEPPPERITEPHVPFLASVIVWYAFSVFCGLWAIHLLASSLERDRESSAPLDERRWWALRFIPLLVCLPPFFGTLVHGQVNLLMLLLVCGAIAACLRGRSLVGGLCLSGAICLKVFPAFLLLYPLWRRDYRFLVGTAAGGFLLVVALPTLYWGPARAWQQHCRFAEVVLMPGLGTSNDKTVAKELTEVTATDSQSLLAIFHKTLYLDRGSRPHHVSAALRMLALLAGGLLAGATLLAGRRRKDRSPSHDLLFFGCLIVVMLALCPVTHLPYFVLLVPLVMALVHHHLPATSPGRWLTPGSAAWNGLVFLFGVNILARILPHWPDSNLFRDLGVSMYAGLMLWLVGVATLVQTRSRLIHADPAQLAAGTITVLSATVRLDDSDASEPDLAFTSRNGDNVTFAPQPYQDVA